MHGFGYEKASECVMITILLRAEPRTTQTDESQDLSSVADFWPNTQACSDCGRTVQCVLGCVRSLRYYTHAQRRSWMQRRSGTVLHIGIVRVRCLHCFHQEWIMLSVNLLQRTVKASATSSFSSGVHFLGVACPTKLCFGLQARL